MSETRAAWDRLKRNVRRLVVSYLLIWAIKATPKIDVRTLIGIGLTLDAMTKDADRDSIVRGKTMDKGSAS